MSRPASRIALLAMSVHLFILAGAGPAAASDDVVGMPDVTITIGASLSDRDVTVRSGAIVRFVNRDGQRHRIRSHGGPDDFDTGNLEPGETYQTRLTTAGTYLVRDERDRDDAAYHGRIVVGGSDSGGNAPVRPGEDVPSSVTVEIGDDFFAPTIVRITAGGSVTFRNGGEDEHTATSVDGGGIDSGTLATGASYRRAFTTPGTYAFLCIFHSDMRGTVEVGGAAPSAPAATPPVAEAPVAPDAPVTPEGPATVSVDAIDFTYGPESITIEVGDRVTWTNRGDAPHTATSEEDSFDSGILMSGEAFTHRFDTPGVFSYLCTLHPEMRGSVVVTAAGAAAPQPTVQPAQAVAPPSAIPDVPVVAADVVEPRRSADQTALAGLAAAIVLVAVAAGLFARLIAGTVRHPG
ncbi:MAG: plastocyanin/azurin family copper-binding protein [Chloroflexota bacterium]